ncbi:MAG: EamA family transporter [Planctomycetota bacterium]
MAFLPAGDRLPDLAKLLSNNSKILLSTTFCLVTSLILHVVFSSAFTLLLKMAQMRKREHVVTIGAINYILAAIVAIPVFWMYNPHPAEFGALWTGGAMGATYFIAFFFAIYAIQTVGASSATVVSVISICIPVTMAAFFFDEIPSAWQISGIVLAMVSLSLISGNRTSFQKVKPASSSTTNPNDQDDADQDQTLSPAWLVPTVLIAFFVLCGMNRVYQEIFKQYQIELHRPAFLLAAFSMAAIPSLVMLIARKRWPTQGELGFGIAVGLCNILQTFFVLKALEHLKGYVVFTVASAGAIVLTTLVATLFMGERLSRPAQIGIAISVIALFLLK